MATQPQVTFDHIIRDPEVQGGEPVIAGTRLQVSIVVAAWREYHDVDTLLQAYPRLTEATLREALAFYDANRDEIDSIIRAQLADG
jgi:uncharacterized protein (DUF433 family)